MTQSAQSSRVLVVDDSPVYRKLVEHALADGGYEALFAKSGSEALRLFKELEPSIVITDWMMPDISGLELCEQIRTGDRRGYTYIILLTGMSEKDSIVKGLASGADDYLTKPFDPGELLARVGVGQRMIELQDSNDAKTVLLEQAARTDSLTGLPNRRAIEDWASRQLSGAARHGFQFWVVHADLDSFKSINDTFGHDAGDKVLQKFASVLRANTRASDICGRMGGDEFLLVITHVDRDNIEKTMQRLLDQFTSTPFIFGGMSVLATASIGVAGFQGKEVREFMTLVEEADQALYAAKRAGRNCVKIAGVWTEPA